MTDKQIIIDSVDVSGCLFYQTNFEEDYDVKIKHYCSNWHNSCESDNNSNCYYKQLKRKEQECEKLYIQLKTDEEYHKEEENTLRKIIKNKEERNIELYKENKKYKQALEEIEKITEEDFNHTCWEAYAGQLKQILQKNSEVENG